MEREEAEQLVQTHGQAVYRLAYARTGNRQDAEDVTQETFLRLVRAAPEFRDGDHCRAWLLRVAANCAGDLFRAPRRRRELPLEEAERVPVPEPEREPGGVLSAVTDRCRIKIYLQVKDLTGERMIDEYNKLSAVMYRGTQARSLLGRCADYDPETHTALFELHDYQEEPASLEEEIVLSVRQITAQQYEFTSSQPLPKELISPEPLECITQEDGRTVLAPGQTVAALEGVDKAELSSMGFAADGTFQVMARLADGASAESEYSYLLTTVLVSGEPPCEEMDQIHYTLDGVAYVGLIFTNVAPADLDGLEISEVYIGVNLCQQAEGGWKLPFQMENLSQVVELPLRGVVGEYPFPTTLTLTPLGGTITGSYELGYLGRQDFAIVYDDGERMAQAEHRGGIMSPKCLSTLANWDFGEPVDLSRAVALELGEWYIPLTGPDAGTAYPIENHP